MTPNEGTPPASAAAEIAAPPTEGKPSGTEPATPPASAAAEIAAPPTEGKPADIDLSKTSDEDYAKLVVPDVEGAAADRSLITPMAKELRAAGIQPSVMAKVGDIYRRVVKAEVERAEAERAVRMKELTEKCLAEITEEERKDFAAAYAEHIAKDAELNHIVLHTELGSSPAFIRLIALAGAALRVETPPPASAAAGSGQTDLDRRIFEKTVPKDLR